MQCPQRYGWLATSLCREWCVRSDIHFASQHLHVTDASGNLFADFLGRFESLDNLSSLVVEAQRAWRAGESFALKVLQQIEDGRRP